MIIHPNLRFDIPRFCVRRGWLRGVLIICLMALTGVVALSSAFADPPTELLRQHCFRCHGSDGILEGDVDLLERTTQDDFLSNSELLADLVRVLEDREMPPEGEPQPTASEYEAMVTGIRALLA